MAKRSRCGVLGDPTLVLVPDVVSAYAMTAKRRTIDDVLTEARVRIRRYAPADAATAATAGAVLIDTRSDIDVRCEGRIPGSVYIHRNVLEWRCDPASGHSHPRVNDLAVSLIIVCNDGYSSSLAAASLVDLGFRNAGDLIGGFRAWAAAGLPVEFPAAPD